MPEQRHPNDYDLYTPVTPELLLLLDRMRREHGSWREVAAISETKIRVLRRLHRVERKAVSMKLLDRLCQATNVGSIAEFTWFTADDLVALGIWNPVKYLEGSRSNTMNRAERRRRRVRQARKLRKKRRDEGRGSY